jgi:hypothetical protein
LKLSALRTVLGSTRYHCKELYITPILRCIIFYLLSKEGTSVYTCEGGLKCFVTFVLYWEPVSIYQGQMWSLDSHVLLSQDRGNSTSLWGTEGLPDAKPRSQCFCFGGSSVVTESTTWSSRSFLLPGLSAALCRIREVSPNNEGSNHPGRLCMYYAPFLMRPS